MTFYILINKSEAYPELYEKTSYSPVGFDTGQIMLPVCTPNQAFDDYIKYSKSDLDNMTAELYDSEGEFTGEGKVFPSRKSERLLELLEIAHGST